MNDRVIYKFKRFKKAKNIYEYALLFNSSNDMLDYVCDINPQSIINSKLYTKNGTYQLIITASQRHNKKLKCTVFQDKFHIDEIRQKNRLICNKNAIPKIQKAFKMT